MIVMDNLSPPRLTVVLGMHRSGTSLCAHALSLLGVDMADEISPHESNAKGHWERWEVVAFHDRVFRHFGQDYYDARHAMPLPLGWWADPAVRLIRDEITAWMRARMNGSRRFGLKDPRISRLLPMWREILTDLAVEARFVVCVRHPESVARSLDRRDRLDPAEGQFRWLAYTADLVNGLGAEPVTVLPYDRWFSDFEANLAALVQLTPGADLENPAMRAALEAVVDPALRHQNAVPSGTLGPAAQLYRLLLASAETGIFNPELRGLAGAFDGFARLVQPQQEELLRQRQAAADLAQSLEASRDQLAEISGRYEAERDHLSRMRASQKPALDAPQTTPTLNGNSEAAGNESTPLRAGARRGRPKRGTKQGAQP